MPGDYTIGSNQWNGLSKVIEECAELQQVLAKIIGNSGKTNYWDSDLDKLLVEELGDTLATIYFFIENNDCIELEDVLARCKRKTNKFKRWNIKDA